MNDNPYSASNLEEDTRLFELGRKVGFLDAKHATNAIHAMFVATGMAVGCALGPYSMLLAIPCIVYTCYVVAFRLIWT